MNGELNQVNPPAGNFRYSYDKNGNIHIVWIDNILQVKYTYDNLNQLIREDNKARGLTIVYTYDANGNRI